MQAVLADIGNKGSELLALDERKDFGQRVKFKDWFEFHAIEHGNPTLITAPE
jgi:hypothetical protein